MTVKIAQQPIPNAVIVGCGLMGTDITAIFLNAGWHVQIIDNNLQDIEAAKARIKQSVAQLGQRIELDTICVFLGSTQEVQWGDVAIVLETATENIDIKKSIFADLDQSVPVHIPIGSNSSGLRISDIAAECTTAHRMANAHFFLPAHLVPLVELAKGEKTSQETLLELKRIFVAVGRVPAMIQKDLPGLLANRIQHALMREAFSLIDQGLASAEDVDAAVRYGFGFRYAASGPIMQKELAGLETQLAAAQAIYGSLCTDATPAKILYKLVDQKRYGTKSLAGFWNWTKEDVLKERHRYESALAEASKLVMTSATEYPAH
jgi:3-hydroxybutyryl-CoA dehydrogenase